MEEKRREMGKDCRKRSYFYASIDPGDQPAEKATVEVFGEGVSGVVGLKNIFTRN